MKIFNWVHRRFNNKENEKKNGGIAADDKQCNVFERWRGGILTIGTFGYDPLKEEHGEIHNVSNYLYGDHDEEFEKDQVPSMEYESSDDDEITDSDQGETGNEDDDEEEEEEESPLVFAAAYAAELDLMEMKMEEKRREEFGGFQYVMMEKKERTTLADLFYADSEEDLKKQATKKLGEINIKEKSKCKHGLSFRKKLMLEEARPIHKLHQLMRRVLKRKIHPEIGAQQHVNSKVSVAMKKCETTSDCASLLPTH